MRNSATIRADLDAIDHDLRVIHCRAKAARLAVDQLRKTALASVAFARGGEDDNAANHVPQVLAFCRSDAGRDLATATAVIDVLEADPSFAEASAVIDPLLDELAAAVEREQAEDHAHRLAEVAVEDAEAAAIQRLAAKVGEDSQVKKARQALAGIRRLGQPLDLDDPADALAAV